MFLLNLLLFQRVTKSPNCYQRLSMEKVDPRKKYRLGMLAIGLDRLLFIIQISRADILA